MLKEELIEKASKGDSEAQYQLGLYYCRLNKEKEALFWIRMSAEQGYAKAKDLLLEIRNKSKF